MTQSIKGIRVNKYNRNKWFWEEREVYKALYTIQVYNKKYFFMVMDEIDLDDGVQGIKMSFCCPL